MSSRTPDFIFPNPFKITWKNHLVLCVLLFPRQHPRHERNRQCVWDSLWKPESRPGDLRPHVEDEVRNRWGGKAIETEVKNVFLFGM